ncbi:MAG: hypothetical protein RR929_02260 [Erysipelotrichaceae bacterium]
METKLSFKDGNHGTLTVFSVTSMASDYDGFVNLLVGKLNKSVKEKGLDLTIKMESASKIDELGDATDIILLAPELFNMEDEVKTKFPNKLVKVIDSKAYGLRDTDAILNSIC